MVNATQYAEDKIMTDLAVHQDPYLDPPQQPHQLYAQPPGMIFSSLTVHLNGMFCAVQLS